MQGIAPGQMDRFRLECGVELRQIQGYKIQLFPLVTTFLLQYVV